MGTDYHRDTSDSIPIQGENHVFEAKKPSGRHYSPDSGEWDGQLPSADIVTPQPTGPEIQFHNWPTILDRMAWARRIIRSHRLPPPQAAVLNEVVYRDGRGNGCSATMETLALDTGYNEKSIRTAIQGLENRTLVLSAGGPGRKKFLTLPVQEGFLLEPTPVTGSEVKPKGKGQTPVRDSGVEEIGEPTPVTLTGVGSLLSVLTSEPVTGVEPNPGNRFRATPVTGSDITGGQQEEREKYIYSSLSPSLSGSTGSPVTVTGVDDSEIERLVEDNWNILKQFWNHQGGATNTYRRKGLDFTIKDIAEKCQKAETADLAARTCVHCQTLRGSADEVKPCIRCEDPICVDDRSSCRQHSCHRKQGGGRKQGPPADWQQR